MLAGLGPEPLDKRQFTAAYLHRCCRGRPTPLKNLLMDNRVVVGIGNIYANEILFAAGISPFTPAARIGRLRAGRLVTAARESSPGPSPPAAPPSPISPTPPVRPVISRYNWRSTAAMAPLPPLRPKLRRRPNPAKRRGGHKKSCQGLKTGDRTPGAGRAGNLFCPRCQR
ncbi:MAG: hypothetical protein U5J62_01160 [Desulfurivibrio sp.]|nr:hypothetical protein [Desulfurivibrio sp.]